MIFNLSRGLTTVREVAPATPPAMKYEVICGLKNGTGPFFASASTTTGAGAGAGASSSIDCDCGGREGGGGCDVMTESLGV